MRPAFSLSPQRTPRRRPSPGSSTTAATTRGSGDRTMKAQRFAAGALAALFTLGACAENPVGPISSASYSGNLPSFTRGSARPYTFTQFDVEIDGTHYPTIPSGINAGGVIVGWYWRGIGCPSNPTTCVMNGFILKDGTQTTVVYHNVAGTNAQFTQLRGIGPNGEIVGSYRMPGEPILNLHGFRYTTTG